MIDVQHTVGGLVLYLTTSEAITTRAGEVINPLESSSDERLTIRAASPDE